MNFWSNFWDFVGFFLWTMVLVGYLYALFAVIADLFRDRQQSGWAKAGWLILMLLVPILTVLIYIIARGSGMAERSMQSAARAQQSTDEYIRSVATTASPADEITKAKSLLDSGAITPSEYEAMKSKALAGRAPMRDTD